MRQRSTFGDTMADTIMRESLEARKASPQPWGRAGRRGTSAGGVSGCGCAWPTQAARSFRSFLSFPCPHQAELDARMAAKHGGKVLGENGHVHDICCGGAAAGEVESRD